MGRFPTTIKKLKHDQNKGNPADRYAPADSFVRCRKIKEEHHGYSDTNNILYVVYNHKRGPVGLLDLNVYIGPGFGIPYAKQMVSHSPRNLQRGHVLVPRVVQNRLSGFQCRSLRGSADLRIKRSIQQNLALDGYSAAPHSSN